MPPKSSAASSSEGDEAQETGAMEIPETHTDGEFAHFTAPSEPGLTRLRLLVQQSEIRCEAEAAVTITDSLLPKRSVESKGSQGMPGYNCQKAPGEL